ncbi:MAG: hypothetical protein ACRC6K_06220 [Fusobacteriaceae bacterium]
MAAFYTSPSAMFEKRVKSWTETYEKLLLENKFEKALEALEEIKNNFMKIDKFTEKWKFRESLDKNGNYSKEEKEELFKNYELKIIEPIKKKFNI